MRCFADDYTRRRPRIMNDCSSPACRVSSTFSERACITKMRNDDKMVRGYTDDETGWTKCACFTWATTTEWCVVTLIIRLIPCERCLD